MVASLGLGNGKLREFKVLFWVIMLLAAKAIYSQSQSTPQSPSPVVLPISVP